MPARPEFLNNKRIILFDQYRLTFQLEKWGAIAIPDTHATSSGEYLEVLQELQGDAGIVHVNSPELAIGLEGLKKMVVFKRSGGAGLDVLDPIYESLGKSGVQIVENSSTTGNGVDFWTNLVAALAVAVNSPLK